MDVSQATVSKPEEKFSIVKSSRKPITIRVEKEIDPNISKLLKHKLKLESKQSEPPSAQKRKVKSDAHSAQSTKKEEEPLKLHIWDFAGHELYYTTHQVILLELLQVLKEKEWGGGGICL